MKSIQIRNLEIFVLVLQAFSLIKPTGYVMHQQFNIQEFYILPHCIYVVCIYLKRNSNVCSKQHKLIGFYNQDEKCLTARYGLGL